jgi:hypothetical protein
MGEKKRKKTLIAAVALILLTVVAGAWLARAQDENNDQGNEMTRKKNHANEPKEQVQKGPLEYDKTMEIYLDTTKVHYKPGELPLVVVYLKNRSKETRFFKRVWSAAGAGGVTFRTYFDGVETLGSGLFSRTATGGESDSPDGAVRLDPGEKKEIMRIKFTRIAEGDHKLQAEYLARYTVAEKTPRNWWNGAAGSNVLTLKVTKNLPKKAVSQEFDSVVKNIHKDLLGMKDRFPDLSGYGGGALKKPKGAYADSSMIEYHATKPKRVDIRVYFNASDYQPNTTALLSEGFPFLGVNLFAHIDVSDPRLRAAAIEVVRGRSKALNGVIRKFESQFEIDVEPFEPDVSAEFARSQIIIRGRIKSAKVEENKPYEYTLKKWILEIKVSDVYRGGVMDKSVVAKCGTLNLIFKDEKIVGNEYIIMMLDKPAWQKEYSIIGAETPRDNLIDWLNKKYKSGKTGK